MRTYGTWLLLSVAGLLLFGCGRGRTRLPAAPPSVTARQTQGRSGQAAFSLTSTVFAEGQPLPSKYTADGDGVTPPLAWTAPPAGAAELVLLMFDPDAPGGTFYHWSLYGLDPKERSLPEDLPKVDTLLEPKSNQGVNSAETVGYYPPAPPAGREHHYTFRLYALQSASGLDSRATPEEVVRAIEGRLLGQAQLVGTYQR